MAKEKIAADRAEVVKKNVIKVNLIVGKLESDKVTLKLAESDIPHGIITMGNHGIVIDLDKLPEKFNSEEHILTGTLTIALDFENKSKKEAEPEIKKKDGE